MLNVGGLNLASIHEMKRCIYEQRVAIFTGSSTKILSVLEKIQILSWLVMTIRT